MVFYLYIIKLLYIFYIKDNIQISVWNLIYAYNFNILCIMLSYIISIFKPWSDTKLRFYAWFVGICVFLILGLLRTATEAEYTFSSMSIIPLVLIAWTGGCRDGYIFSLLLASMWTAADLVIDRHFSASWIPFANGSSKLITYCFISYLINHIKTLLAHEQQLATHDELTMLLNRRAFFEEGHNEFERSKRYNNSIGVAFIDLDNFKKINDLYGHKIGDLVLKLVSDALVNILRSTDYVARLGGDEFALLLPEIDLDSANDTGVKIKTAIDLALKDYPPVSASVGVSWTKVTAGSFTEMVAAADAQMYEHKRIAKNNVSTC